MNKPFYELRKAIEEKRSELYEKIEQQSNYEDILKVSRELDKLIALYYEIE